MPNGTASSFERELNDKISSREEAIKYAQFQYKEQFEKDFELQFTVRANEKTQKVLDDQEHFLTAESIDKLDKNGPDHGYSKKEVAGFKNDTKKYHLHDLRGTQLNAEETSIVRAVEYKEYYEKTLNSKIDLCKNQIEKIKEAAVDLIKLEKQREPLLNKIENCENQIADLESELADRSLSQQEKDTLASLKAEKTKFQKEYDNFFLSTSSLTQEHLYAEMKLNNALAEYDKDIKAVQKMTQPSKKEGVTNNYFNSEFSKFEKNCSYLDDFIDSAVEDWNKKEAAEKENAKAAAEAKKQQEAAEKEAKEAAEKEAAKRAQKAVEDALEEAQKKEDAQPFYTDKKMREYQKQFKEDKVFQGSTDKLIETSRNLLEGDDKKIFNDYINALNKNSQAKSNQNKLNFDKEFMKDSDFSLNEGKNNFNNHRILSENSKLESFHKYKNFESIMNGRHFFVRGSKEEFFSSLGTLQAAHQYFNSLQAPRRYNGPEKDNYTIAYEGLQTCLRSADDKLRQSTKDSVVLENMIYQMNDKVACKKGIRPDILKNVCEDAIDLYNPGRETYFNKEKGEDNAKFEKEINSTKLNAYFEAYNNIHGANKDKFMQKLQYATAKLNKESSTIEKQVNDNQKEERIIDGKNKLDTFTRESEKFNKKNWFARLFDRRGKAELARQRNELNTQYGYSNTQLDIAKYGSKLDASKLTKIIAKAEKTPKNAQLFADTIQSFGLEDKKLSNAYNEFAKDCQEVEPSKAEATNSNRKQIILEEVKDAPQQTIQNDLENSKSLNLEKSIEESEISVNK